MKDCSGTAALPGVLVLMLALGGLLLTGGCGGDDGASPLPTDEDHNAIVIDPSPDSLNAPWTMAGPDGFTRSGNGDRMLEDLLPGEYWVVWGEVEGWYTPPQNPRILAAADTVTFSGVYEFIGSGTIVVDPSPDSPAMPWTLAGPEDFSLTASGDSTLVEMLPGQYTLTWEALTGWIRPGPETQDLARDQTITFAGTYTENSGTGTITVDTSPEYIQPPWTLYGPDSFQLVGAGDKTLPAMTAGEYTLVWENLSGWIPPDQVDGLLLGGGNLTFSGTYVETSADPGFKLLPPAVQGIPVSFTMGSHVDEDETPHQVTLTHRFHMGEMEVTNGQYVELLQWAFDRFYVVASPYAVHTNLDLGTANLLDLADEDCQIDFSNGKFTTPFPDRPVIDVSWYGAAAYCDWLSLYEGYERAYNHYNWRCNNNAPYGAAGYRLPTEAEWELACRAGTVTHYNTGDCIDPDTEANFNGLYPFAGCPDGASIGHTVDVGSYPPNAWGLYDMHGNVYEWCNDRYAPYTGDAVDPVGSLTATNRVVRGGGFSFEGIYCRSAERGNWAPTYFAAGTGFRVVRTAE